MPNADPSGRSDAEAEKAVEFAEISHLLVIERPDKQESAEYWYSSQEYEEMRAAAKCAVRRARQTLLWLPSSGDLHATLNDVDQMGDAILTGIEHLLTPKTTMAIKKRRSRCVGAVLLQQSRTGAHDAVGIATAANRHSRQAALNARINGVGLARDIDRDDSE